MTAALELQQDISLPVLSLLPDALLLSIASYLSSVELVRLESVNNSFRGLDTDALWKQLCIDAWRGKPRYEWNPTREIWLKERISVTNNLWKNRFIWVKRDLQRKIITQTELQSLGWYFNFTPMAGGQGRATLRRAIFDPTPTTRRRFNQLDNSEHDEEDHLYNFSFLRIDGMPSFPYRLVSICAGEDSDNDSDDENNETLRVQALIVHHFPPHYFQRTLCGEWLITNDFVTFVSCDENGTLIYKERGFQKESTTNNDLDEADEVERDASSDEEQDNDDDVSF